MHEFITLKQAICIFQLGNAQVVLRNTQDKILSNADDWNAAKLTTVKIDDVVTMGLVCIKRGSSKSDEDATVRLLQNVSKILMFLGIPALYRWCGFDLLKCSCFFDHNLKIHFSLKFNSHTSFKYSCIFKNIFHNNVIVNKIY